MNAGVAVNGTENAKKEPPKLIEKVIDSVEEFLTQPATNLKKKSKPKKEAQKPQPPQQTQPVQQTAAQEQVPFEPSSEYILPEGTTIKLPDGNEFETHAKSKISKA